jgi:dethiobiotin synthetase
MKKKIYFVTATNTDVGKTTACEILLNRFAKKGKKVGYFKVIETGVKKYPKDAKKMLKVAKRLNNSYNMKLQDVVGFCFELPASPFVASGGKYIDINIIKSKINYLLKFCDVLICEGAGGLMVPINQNYYMIDLIKELNCKTILISPSNLGSINDTLLSQMALDKYGIKYKWYINLFKDKKEFKKVTLPFYKANFGKMKFLQKHKG